MNSNKETKSERRTRVLHSLIKLLDCDDTENVHREADRLLLELIGDKEIADAFRAIEKWYS